MKKTNIIYWIFTGIFAAFMVIFSIPYVSSEPDIINVISNQLGYPAYIIPLLGVAKLLGIAAILIPGYPRIKEWAYAGLAYDLLGATYSIIAIGPDAFGLIFMSIVLIFEAVSYVYYHKRLKA